VRSRHCCATKNVLLVNFRDRAHADAAKRLAAANFSPPNAVPTPTSVRALRRVTAAPFVLGVVLTVLLVVSCAYLLATSVRARRRDLAILRALGSNRRQLRAIIHWQATLMTALVLLVGRPCGVVLGSWIVKLVTDALGIVPGADVPALFLLGGLDPRGGHRQPRRPGARPPRRPCQRRAAAPRLRGIEFGCLGSGGTRPPCSRLRGVLAAPPRRAIGSVARPSVALPATWLMKGISSGSGSRPSHPARRRLSACNKRPGWSPARVSRT
jgi:FtsX-like permease family